MPNTNPTIVQASLDDKELQASINKMVANFDKGLQDMLDHSNKYVEKIQESLQKIGDTNFGAKGSNDGGVAKRTKSQNAETDAVEKNIAARDKQIKKNQEVSMSYDQMAAATQKATSGSKMSVIETYDMQIEMFKNRLREVRQDIDIFNAAIGSGKKTQIEWGQQGLKQANAEAEKLMRIITTLENQRGNLANVLAPQGHTIQNYVNSLQKANPELAQLNEQFKRGQSLLQQGKTAVNSVSNAFENGTNISKKSLDELNAYVAQSIQRERERRDSIRQTGLAARETADQLIRSAHEQASVQGNTPITGIKELTVAVEQMRRAYFDMSTSERTSPIGQALEADIKRANEAITVIRKYNQSLLGAQQNDANKITNASTLDSLRESLKNLTEQYNRLTVAELNAGKGDALIQHFQNTTRAAQILQRTLNRPVSLKAALTGDERTLDDIAYKMQRLRSYKQGIDLTKPNAANEIKQVDEALARLQKDADKWMSKSQEMIKSNTALGRSWNYMKNRLAFYFTVGAGTQFIKNLIEVRSQYEMNEKALGILLDSASRGTRIFNELSQMSLVSPYTLIELSSAAKQLTAYDIAAKDVVDTTRRLADMASAVGVPVERLTYALGQIKAYGYLNSRDARMFANAGIPLVKQLADRYSELEGKMVSTADVYDRMKKKAIDYNDVMAVINKMTDEGGKFFDFQAKMAETLKVRLANLTLAWNNMLNDMGKDNQGVMTTGLKGLTVMFKHWRELYRVISTAITALGAYKVATIIAGMATKTSIGGSAVTSWFALARGIKSAKDAAALFSLTVKSIPFAGWVTAIASIVSYFVLFNNSADETKQKLQDIATAFEGIRKEATDLFVDAINTDNIGTQLTKLKDMLELAETELGVTIPINLEDVNESNIKQKLRETKNTIDNYINFSQSFSEAAVDTRFNESMTNFGTTARSVYTSVTESINSVKVALQGLVDAGKASKRDIEILKELDNKPKDGESRIEYFQRLVKLYEELGLIAKKKITTPIGSPRAIDNMFELQSKQEESLDRLGVKNKTVFKTMLSDVQDYYTKSGIAAYQFEEQVKRVAKSINLENIPVSERTAKLEVAINQEAAKNNWNEFAIQYAKWVANQKFGLNITISEESKKDSEIELSDWQKRMQAWADKNGITFSLNFMEKEDEKTYADRMLQAAKDAQGRLDVQRRKLGVGTGSQAAVDAATKEYNNARLLASQAGADLSSLDKKTSSSRRSAAKAESELAKILRDELSTIDKVRSIYKDLTKSGMSHADAVERATKGWEETVNAINKVLQKNGLQKLDLSKFAGIENPRGLVDMLQSQLDILVKRGAKPAEIKELQTKIRTLKVDSDKYDLTKITKGLNSELGKLKEEYELAVELDANPELGGMFADFMGINMDELPKTFQEATKKAQEYIDKVFKDNGRTDRIDIASMLDKESFDNWVKDSGLKMDSELVKSVEAFRQYLHKIQVDETKKQIDEWSKLLEKYAEYEYKRKQILDTYEREMDVARKQNADKAIRDAIERRKNEQLAELDFNEFMKTPEWIVATGDLAGMSKQAIGMLIKEIERYKKTARNLSPKQIHNLNKALKNLYKEQRKNNPFRAISNMLEEARERAETFDEEIEKVQKEIQDLTFQKSAELAAGIVNEDTDKRLKNAIERLKELKKKKEALGKIDASDWVQSINDTVAAVRAAVSVFDDLAKAIGGVKGNSDIDKIFSVLEKGGQGAAIGAQIGQGYGAIIGAVAGVATGLISIFAGAENERITAKVEESERAVKRLENTYKNLSHTAEEAYGAMVSGAKKAMQSNKELQLVELKRQLALEKSRDSKHRDEDKIADLEGQIIDLKNEIHDATQDIINDLLDISSAGDGIESLVSVMIEAFRNGEDAMEAFGKEWDKMIDNMILKLIVTQFMKQAWDTVMGNLKKKQEEFLKKPSQAVADAQKEVDRLSTMSDAEIAEEIARKNGTFDIWGWIREGAKGVGVTNNMIENYKKAAQDALTTATEVLNGQSLDYTKWSLDYMNHEGRDYMMQYAEMLKNSLGDWYTYGENNTKELSALQQGLQSMSESTAESLEAYMNGVSQQVYLHSDLLTQIRDAVVGMDMDVQVATQAQMLLQLQQSYAVQMAIQGILEGWTNPSGQAVRVELVS